MNANYYRRDCIMTQRRYYSVKFADGMPRVGHSNCHYMAVTAEIEMKSRFHVTMQFFPFRLLSRSMMAMIDGTPLIENFDRPPRLGAPSGGNLGGFFHSLRQRTPGCYSLYYYR